MKKNLIITLLIVLFCGIKGWAQIKTKVEQKSALKEDRDSYLQFFQSAADEFAVPVDVLKGISFSETRWSHLTWEPGDTVSCMGMPHPYGIMSLWDNDFFGHSLKDAAVLIGKDVQTLKDEPLQNIRGAAALLKKLYEILPIPEETMRGEIESWRNAIAAYSGLPQEVFAQEHALDVYSAINSGYHQHGIIWNKRIIKLDLIKESVGKIFNERKIKNKSLNITENVTNKPDYPLAKWVSSYPGHWYTSGNNRSFIVIHDMESYYLSTISYFQQQYQGTPPNTASVYYCVNSKKDNSSDAPAGEITQMVEEKYWAWHARCWNTSMFGIEHEGFADNPAWFTTEMYNASSQLVKYLCDKYAIPKDRNHIIGHNEWQNSTWVNWVNSTNQGFDPTCNTHHDPGPNWDWTGFMNLITTGDTPPICNNDNPCSPKSLSINTSGNCVNTSCSTINANPPSPDISFYGSATCNSPYQSIRYDDDVWFSITPATSSPITIKVIPTSNISNFDIAVGLYQGNCSSPTQVGCADLNPKGGTENLIYTPTANTPYLIRVFSYDNGSTYSGNFDICVTSSTTTQQPDLIVQSPQVSPSSVVMGQQVTATCYNKNQGTGNASSSVTSLWFTKDQNYDNTDDYLGEISVPSLNVGITSSQLSKQITIPTGPYSLGTWYILFGADGADNVDEGSNEGNNQVFVPIELTGNPPTQYSITTSSNPTNGGSTTGNGTYPSGQSLTVTASANSGYTFQNWTENSTPVYSDASYQFNVTGNRNLVANFNSCSYSLNTNHDDIYSDATSLFFWVYTTSDCSWTATKDASDWVTFTNATGNGNGMVAFNVAENPTTIARQCIITVEGNTYTLTQYGYEPPCSNTPVDPTDLEARVDGSNTIYVSWLGNNTYVSDFNIERSLSANGPFSIIGFSGTNFGYSDTAVTGGTTYYYRVRACCNDNCSNYSNIASQKACTYSTQQTGATASANEICQGESVTMTVQGGSLGTDAEWVWRTTQCNSGPIVGTGSSITVTPDNDEVYVVKPEGGDCILASIYCAVVYITVNKLPEPASTISGSDQVTQGSTNVIYTVPIITGANEYIWTLPDGATGTSTTNSISVNFGNNAVSGNIEVKGFNNCGEGIGSTLVITVNSACTTPTTQSSLITFSGVGTNTITANWTNGNGSMRVVKINTSNSFSDPVNGTDPTANTSYSGSGEQIIYNGVGNSVTVTGLSEGTTYWFRVYEANCTGNSSLYYTATASNNPNSQNTLSSCTTPGIPSSATGSATGQTTANLSWSAGSPAGSAVVTYYWVVGTSPSVTYGGGVAQSTTTGTSASATGLSPGTTYYLRVYAKTSCDGTNSWYRTSSSFTTDASCVAPVSPTSATASLSTINLGQSTTLQVNGGVLNDAPGWLWYTESCGGSQVGTGVTLSVSPTTTTTFYVQASACGSITNCRSVTINVIDEDSDNDGVMNNIDSCPDTPSGESVDDNGCSDSQLDDDNDGVMNNIDICPNTQEGEIVDENGCPKVQFTYVPDDNFEQALIDFGYDDVVDDYVLTSNIETVTSLIVRDRNIYDLTGIEDFVALTHLECMKNKISSINLTENIALEFFDCWDNLLTNLDLTNNIAIETLRCNNNHLTQLEVANNPLIITLECSSNELSSLDVSSNTNLVWFNCSHNDLSEINLESNPKLGTLWCTGNLLTNLNISKNAVLTNLACRQNQLKSLNLKNGNNSNFISVEVNINPELRCIQVDDVAYAESSTWIKDVTANYSEDCSCIEPEILIQPENQSVSNPDGTSFSISASGSNNLYHWEMSEGFTWHDIPDNPPYSNVNTATLNISSITTGMDGYQYRCIVSSSCTSGIITSIGATLTINSCTSPAAPTVGAIIQPTCATSTGSVVLNGLPSSGTWILTRSPGGIITTGSGTSKTITGLIAGTYTYSVANAEGCTSNASANVIINAQPETAAAPTVGTIIQPTCATVTGSVILSGLPSSGTWTLTRSPGGIITTGSGTSKTIIGLAAGTYNYTVINSSGCISPISGEVVLNHQSEIIVAPIDGATEILNQPNLVIEFCERMITCATMQFIRVYELNNTSGNTLAAKILVTEDMIDGNIVTIPLNSTTIQPDYNVGHSGTLKDNQDYVVIADFGSICYENGDVWNGIDNPITWNWTTGYNSAPTAPAVEMITHPTCGVTTGSVILNSLPSSGTWTITRTPGGVITTGTGVSKTIAGLPTGTYNFTVTNAEGYISNASADVVINPQPTTPGAPTVSTITQPTCSTATGGVVLNGLPSSGTWTLTRTPGGITTMGTGLTKTITGLAAGTYTYTVTNADGCISGASGNVVLNAQPSAPSAPTVGTITQPTCATATGNVVLNGLPSSGTWTLTRTPGGITTTGTGLSKTITGLAAGTYNFTVTNADECTSNASATVVINIQPSTPTAPIAGPITQPSCTEATGSIFLYGLPVSENWTLTRTPEGAITTGTGSTISGLSGGTYSFTATNSAGCISDPSADIVVNTPPTPPLAPTVGPITQPTCTFATGSVFLYGLPEDGSWTLTCTPNGTTTTGTGTGITISGLSAGSYTFTITNAEGCISNASANVVINLLETPATPIITIVDNVLHSTSAVGNQWYNENGIINGATNQDYTVTKGGNYYVIVSLNGCSSESSDTINFIPTGTKLTEVNNHLKVYPNPTTGILTIEGLPNNEKTAITLYDMNHKLIRSQTSNSSVTKLDISDVVSGSYLIVVNNRIEQAVKIIKE